jgi:hypothetical protein
VYPSGSHIDGTAAALVTEKVRRARICLDIIQRYLPSAEMSPVGGKGLGIPDIK